MVLVGGYRGSFGNAVGIGTAGSDTARTFPLIAATAFTCTPFDYAMTLAVIMILVAVADWFGGGDLEVFAPRSNHIGRPARLPANRGRVVRWRFLR
jgi:hypothetical protein